MSVYEFLFGDQDLDEVMLDVDFPQGGPLDTGRARMWEGNAQEAANVVAGALEPWASFIVALARKSQGQSPVRQLRSVAENGFLEARARLWAWTALRQLGEQPAQVHASEVLGIVVEVPVDDGLDVFAAYSDGSVRYLNHAGRLVARETAQGPDASVVKVLGDAFPLLSISPAPRDKDAPPPEPGTIRFVALSARGLHTLDVKSADVEPSGQWGALFAGLTKLLAEVVQIQ
ncbi:MAG TPA: hypothetical protein VL400_08070 [Polyangiaceae bacterium]|nr:hypothetical protein [Polyangiaceae bacterium]